MVTTNVFVTIWTILEPIQPAEPGKELAHRWRDQSRPLFPTKRHKALRLNPRCPEEQMSWDLIFSKTSLAVIDGACGPTDGGAAQRRVRGPLGMQSENNAAFGTCAPLVHSLENSGGVRTNIHVESALCQIIYWQPACSRGLHSSNGQIALAD